MASSRLLKRELRQQARRSLAELSPSSIAEQTSRALSVLFSLSQYRAAKEISVFLSMPAGELSTADVVNDALENGKHVFVPYIYQQSRVGEKPTSMMDMVELHSRQDYEALEADSWGIPTPSAKSIPSRLNCFGGLGKTDGRSDVSQEREQGGLDVIVMPGMLFDRDLGRLGHGKGFYDSFLDRYRIYIQTRDRCRMPFLVGLALDEQILPPGEQVPMDTTDFRLDALVTGGGDLLQPNSHDRSIT